MRKPGKVRNVDRIQLGSIETACSPQEGREPVPERIAVSAVLPSACDEYESASHIKCQPTPRIAASSSDATVPIASAHPWKTAPGVD
jgi:hypothetical protein